MLSRANERKQELIDKVVEQLHQRLSGRKAKDAETFVRAFYDHVPPDDLIDRTADNLYGAALTLWNFAQRRPADGRAKIRVYNPDLEEHGWKADHTIIEVINTDMPFLVDSVTAALNDLDLTVHLVIHPILRVKRTKSGGISSVAPLEASDDPRESIMHVEIDEQSSGAALDKIAERIDDVLEDVRLAVEDWARCRRRVLEILDGLGDGPAGIPADETKEAIAFLKWIHDDHFTFLGYREYDFTEGPKGAQVKVDESSQLGILRRSETHVLEELRNLGALPPEVQSFVKQPKLLLVTKANRRSTVHRPVHMDTIFVKKFDAKGRVIGQHLFVGLFTSVAYNLSPRQIPLLRKKLEDTVRRANFPAASHDGKALVNIVETFPRDELFQADEDELFPICMGILNLQERQRIALFLRRDAFERFVSCLIYCPRDRFNTKLRLKFQAILEKAFDGRVTAQYTQIGDSPLARLHVVVKTQPGKLPAYNIDRIEAKLVDAAQDWNDTLKVALIQNCGEERGLRLFRRYVESFPADYQERFSADAAVLDIERMERVIDSRKVRVNLYHPLEAAENELRFKIYNPDRPVPLSDVLPMLENMGLKVITELPYTVTPRDSEHRVMMHDFGVVVARPVALAKVREKFQDLFIRVWDGDVENDGFNRLVLLADLNWREVVVLRAYCKYLRQIGIAFSQDYMESTLASNPELAHLLAKLFIARFQPERDDALEEAAAKLLGQVIERLDAVLNPDEDRILRHFLNLIQATLRTNYFQTAADGAAKPYLSFKFESEAIDDLPLPRPWREIFVYSPRVEAVHLRGGPVARGGIRWSDRREDFRTEILGLVKAQMVKNAVIVPVGSKGGFVLKRPPADGGREAVQQEGVACYRIMMCGLLDITDNIVGGAVVPPTNVLRLDGDDPYLVVAADKGTATFSDIANGIAEDYGFWLGDAFASGGSQGYDHKKMGITARGAWESVKRHFRELGKDIQTTPFTAVGVGDMSGDVFGNGMLLSRQIRLIGAFNHMHIFIDPDPDPETSWQERKRLFDLPRSAWSDYDPKLLSAGGRIYERKAKKVTLTPEIKALLGLASDTVTPTALIGALLRAEVELMWFGGIGTYVKAADETHAMAGDRANDAIRVNGTEVRAKVIGEGANLGLTQRGRIEYARRGGRCNTDAIDNAGGVNCSDHEVNIKILLGEVVANGDMTVKQRNQLLVDMTDEVAELVLRDNYLQSQAISVIHAGGSELLHLQSRMMRMLERHNRLNRALEYLPDDEDIAERLANHQGLTRPEISVLLPYAKIWVYDEILASDLPDDPMLVEDLVRYFPTPVQQRYRNVIAGHRLRREIIATVATNSLVNRVGGTFIHELAEASGARTSDIARAYLIARTVFGLRDIWADIEALDNAAPAAMQVAMLRETIALMESTTLWFLRNCPQLEMEPLIGEFGPPVGTLIARFDEVVAADPASAIALDQRAVRYVEQGIPEALARRVAALPGLVAACDIARIAQQKDQDVIEVGRAYFAVGARFRLGELRAAAETVEAETHWQKLAKAAAIDDLFAHQRDLARTVLDGAGNGADPEHLIATWTETHARGVERSEQLFGELSSAGSIDLAMLAVANRQLRSLVGG